MVVSAKQTIRVLLCIVQGKCQYGASVIHFFFWFLRTGCIRVAQGSHKGRTRVAQGSHMGRTRVAHGSHMGRVVW